VGRGGVGKRWGARGVGRGRISQGGWAVEGGRGWGLVHFQGASVGGSRGKNDPPRASPRHE